MPFRFNRTEQFALVRTLAKWCTLGAWVGLLSGAASALFLHALAWATDFRVEHPLMLWGLPAAGVVIALTYGRYGKSVEAGNNLLLERVHNPNESIPFRMAPLVLLSTVLTHLFGGSTGREGTAVQMGGTLANLAKGPLRLSPRDHRILIMSGISGGFGSVFGTPLAGAVFGLEVLSIGRIGYEGLIPCFTASLVGDTVTRALGIHHHLYSVGAMPVLTPWVWTLILVAGALFAGASTLFAELTHAIHRWMKLWVAQPVARPLVGGILVISLTYVVGSRDYLGLSLPLIERSFSPEGASFSAVLLKILFTAITLGTGFKGGEVTPLFCIGATLGAAFGAVTGQPTGFFAALGFVAVFAGAANTPLACTLMGIELFGASMAVPLAAACILSYILSGHRGIYLSQQISIPKSHEVHVVDGTALRDAREGAMDVTLSHYSLKGLEEAASTQGDQRMQVDHVLTAAPHGLLRIFMRSGDQTKGTRLLERLFPKPASAAVLKAAHDYGLPQGFVKQCTSGFLRESRIEAFQIEGSHAGIPIYVELHGTREALEGFCEHAKELLQGRPIVYKEAEHWHWAPPEEAVDTEEQRGLSADSL